MSVATDTATPETTGLPSAPSDELWTSDSQRADESHVTELAPEDLAPEPAKELTHEIPAEPVATPRDEAGKFKGKGKPRTDPQARVETATAKEAAAKEEARIAREEAAQLKRELEEARRQPAPQPTERRQIVVPGAPFAFPAFDKWLESNPEKDWDAYHDAKLDARDTWREEQQSERAQYQAHADRLTAAIAADPQWPQTWQAGSAAIANGLKAVGLQDLPPVIAKAVVASPKSIEILRHFVAHPEVAVQLAVETHALPVSAVSVVRRLLESALPTAGAVATPDSASSVRPSTAKPPINRVGGTASATPADPDDLEFGPEYIRTENARDKQRREASRW